MIGLDRVSFFDMTPREFFNAWLGYMERDKANLEYIRDAIWVSTQQSAVWSAQSYKQARAIARQKAPWVTEKKKTTTLMYEDVIGLLNSISK